ncbi:MAG: hypothetical protein R2697_02275 [Ilumatobacteraceae bacterium]
MTEAAVDVVSRLDDLGDLAVTNEAGSTADADVITAAIVAEPRA